MIKKILSLLLALSILLVSPGMLSVANAAALTGLSDTMSNQTQSGTSTHFIEFTTPTGVTATAQTIVVTFPSGFNFTSYGIGSLSMKNGTSCSTPPLSASSTCSGGSTATIAASAGASTWGAAFSGTNQVVLTLTAPTTGTGYIAAGNTVIIGYTTATNSINPSSAANYSISLTVNGDTGSITVPILSNSQVAVTATVSQTLSFAISANSLSFGTLSVSAPQYATTSSGTSSETSAHTITASTNGTSGYTITLSGDTLKSGSNSITALGASPTALAAGSSQFGIRATTSGGSGTVSSPYNGSAGNYGFGTSLPLANATFATATAATATTTYSVFYGADISATTPAGSYSTTLTYVAAANF